MADFGLADTVNATEALFQTVRVPRQVVLTIRVSAALKVYTFPGGVVGNHHADDWIRVERGDGGTASLPRDATMNDYDGSRITHPGDNFVLEIFNVLCPVKISIFTPKPRGDVEHDRLSRIESSSRH